MNYIAFKLSEILINSQYLDDFLVFELLKAPVYRNRIVKTKLYRQPRNHKLKK